MGDDTYGYAYDPIGNRTSATENTETTGYTANGLNQYSQISAPSVPSVVHPVCDANGQQKSAKPKAQPPGDRDFEAARMRGARSRRRRRGGNCNVTEYVATNGASVARREYDPFGRTTVAAGAMADDFNFWFSTKYLDRETGMSCYGYRFYAPELGRWPSRDPIEERGGLNLYGFVGNDPVNRIDRLGLFPLTRDLEVELDYQKVPVRKGKNATHFANTRAHGPDIVDTTDAEIVREGKCCARVKCASKRKMIIHAHWLSEDAIGRFVTDKGYNVIIEHEHKRGGALIAGFIAYFGPVSGLGTEATKCGIVCRKGGFEVAKWELEDYLGRIRLDAWSQFYDYSLRAQGDIEMENQVGNAIFVMENGNLLFDGHRNSYNYRLPVPFRATTPCPKSE